MPAARTRPSVWSDTGDLLRSGVRVLRRGGSALALFYVLSQAVVALVAMPILGWLVQEALAVAGLTGIDTAELGAVFDTPLSLGLFILVMTLGYFVVLTQLLLVLVAVRRVRADEGLGMRAVFAEFGALLRRLLHPASLGLMPYLLMLLPLAGFGYFSVLTRTIAVPSFISGELTKSVPGIIGYVAFLLVIGTLCTRFALTLPLFLTAQISGAKASRLSWRLTKHSQTPLAFAVITLLLAGFLAGFLILLLSILPTLLTDALLPGASAAVAAIGLALAVTLGILFMGIAVVMLAAILLRCLETSLASDSQAASKTGPVHGLTEVHGQPDQPAGRQVDRQHGQRRSAVMTTTALVVLAAGAGALTAPLIFQMSQQPSTQVLAHRGFSDIGVENTISGLVGANEAGSDLVEIDVMQTADEEFVVLHDPQLGRLADLDKHIADLTLAEATAITVRDLAGHEDRIPSLAEYLEKADELDQQLLVEIKLHGRETPDSLEQLVAQMEQQGALSKHIYHTLSSPTVEQLKRMRPSLTVGYTMAFAGTALPRTSADFVVVEEWSYSEGLTREAHQAGLGMYVWTVNDEMKIRQLLRDNVDGIITDHPDIAVTARQQMTDDDGLANVLFDTIMRFVTIF